MKVFTELLRRFDETLQIYNPAAYENLLPPSSDVEIEKSLREIGITDVYVKELFQWKGGTKDPNEPSMMQAGSLLTFNSIKESIEDNDCYDPALIPLVSDNGEVMLLFNTNPGPHYGKIYFYSISSLYLEHPISMYDSLYTMLQTTIKAYQERAYEFNDDWLEIDGPKLREIAEIYNPNSKYYTNYDSLDWEKWYEI